MEKVAKSIILNSLVPEGEREPREDHFRIGEEPSPVCKEDGDVLLQVLAISADPYLRLMVKQGPFPRRLEGYVAGKVVESMSEEWPVGSIMAGDLPFVTRQVSVESIRTLCFPSC
jgi:NADPH-dependent curcumin reductase CurA